MADRARWLVALLALVAGLALRGQDLAPLVDDLGDRDNPSELLRDFRDTIYEPGRDVLDGHNPYDPEPYLARHPGHQELDLYTPHFLVVAVPYSLLPIAVAQALWLVVLAASVVLLALAGWRLADRRPPPVALVATVGLILLANPVTQGLRTGNISLPCCAALAWVLANRRDHGVLVVLAGAGAFCKPQLGLPLVCLLLAEPLARRVGVRIIGLTAAVCIAPVAVLAIDSGGIGGLLDVVSRNLEHSADLYGSIADNAALERADLWGAVAKLTGVDPSTGLQLLTFVAITAIAVVARRRAGAVSLAVTVAAAAVVLGLPHYSYDLVLVLPPLVVMVAEGIRTASRSVLVAGVALVVVAAHIGAVDSILDKAGLSLDLRQSIDATALAVAFAAGVYGLVRAQPVDSTAAIAAR